MRSVLLLISIFSTFYAYTQKKSGEYYVKKAFEVSETQPDSGLIYSQKAIEIGILTKDSLIIGSGYVQLGSAYRIKGEAHKSMEALHLALEYLPHTTEGQNGIASAHSTLGNLYYSTGQNEKAKKHYWKAFRLKRQAEKYEASAYVATQLAGIYSIDSTSDSTFYFSQYVFKHLESKQNPIFYANVYNALGAEYSFDKQKLDSALYYYQKASKLFRELGFKTQMAVTQCNIGSIYLKQDQFNLAEKAYLDALKSLPEEADLFYRLGIVKELSNIYFITKRYEDYAQIDQLKDSLNTAFNSTKNNKDLMELEEKYKSAQKDKELHEQKIQIQKSELELSAEREKFYAWFIGLLIVLVILGIVFIYIYLKRRNEKKLEKEKERFFSNIVHEIRTPLTLISAPVAQLKSKSKDTETKSRFNLIERNILRLSNLVNQLLDISKIDAKKYRLNYAYGNLALFLYDITENAQQLAKEKDIAIALELEACDQIVQLDFDALEKILFNLITNAIKYSNSNTTILIKANLQNDSLQILVKDQGKGIPEKLQQKIFKRFDRGDNLEPNKGVGIGLSLVQELCRLLKADISLKSAPGKGTEISLNIPVKGTYPENKEQTKTTIEKTILLVEDDPDMRLFIKELLTEKGFYVMEASNGLDALDILNKILPTLILTDAMMPEMDGYTFVNEIKKSPLYNHIPVVFLSAKASSESKVKGLKTGADFYLEKPFIPEELLLTIENTIETINQNQKKFTEHLTNEKLSFEEKITSEDPFIHKLNGIVLQELDNPDLTIESLAQQMAISRSQLHRKVKSVSGKSISHYIRVLRLEKAIELLRKQNTTVSEAAYTTGFNSQSYFTKCFSEHFGFPPSQLGANSSQKREKKS